MRHNDLVMKEIEMLLETLKKHKGNDILYGELKGFLRCAYFSDCINEEEFVKYDEMALEIRYH